MKKKNIILKKTLTAIIAVFMFLTVLPAGRVFAVDINGPGIFYYQRPDLAHESFAYAGAGSIKINFYDADGKLVDTYTDVKVKTIKPFPAKSKYMEFFLNDREIISVLYLYYSGGPTAPYDQTNSFSNKNIIPNFPNPTPLPSVTPTPEPTPEPTATPTPTPTPKPTSEVPSGDRAILVITLTTGIEKEFDLPISEVNVFLNWYDSASGSNRYGINKHDNNKGPFSKRTEYVIHDKILTFEVSEYTAQ